MDNPHFWMFTFVKNQAIQGFEKFSVPFMILEWREKNRFEVVKILFSNQRNESDFNNISWKNVKEQSKAVYTPYLFRQMEYNVAMFLTPVR